MLFFVLSCHDDASWHNNEKRTPKIQRATRAETLWDVHNLTEKAQVRHWGGCPSFLFTLLPFLPAPPPSLHHFLSASQRTSDAGVCERAQSMKHNPSTKVFQSGCETFFAKTNQTTGRDTEKWTIKTAEKLRERFGILEVLRTTAHV